MSEVQTSTSTTKARPKPKLSVVTTAAALNREEADKAYKSAEVIGATLTEREDAVEFSYRALAKAVFEFISEVIPQEVSKPYRRL